MENRLDTKKTSVINYPPPPDFQLFFLAVRLIIWLNKDRFEVAYRPLSALAGEGEDFPPFPSGFSVFPSSPIFPL